MPFGEGCIDFVGIFETLRQLNYRGSFLIEMWTEKAKEPVLEIQARRWIEARMQEAGFLYVEQLKADVLAANLALLPPGPSIIILTWGNVDAGRRHAAMDGDQTFRRRVQHDDRRRYGGG